MSLLKRVVFAVIWGISFGLVLGLLDCIRIGFLYYQGGLLSPYLVDCITIFTVATAKMIFFAAAASLCTVLFLHCVRSRPFQYVFQDLPLCGSLLFLAYALLVLFLHPEPIWTARLHGALYLFAVFPVSFLIWAILKGWTGFSFPGKKISGFCAAGLVFVLLVSVIALQIRYTGILKSRNFTEGGRGEPFPDILLVVLDTVRYDRLSCYGYDKPVTPVIDGIAAEGVLFKNCISDSIWTLPSHASIFTGLYAPGHRVSFINFQLAEEFHTVPEILQSRGYQTVGFMANPAISHTNHFTQGFDYCKTYNNNEITKTEIHLLGHILWRRAGLSRLSAPKSFPPYTLFQKAIDLNQDVKNWFHVEYSRDKPFFLCLNFMEAHFPYQPPEPFKSQFSSIKDDTRFITRTKKSRNYFRGKYRIRDQEIEKMDGLYTASIAYLDHCLGQLFDWLQKEGFSEDLVLIITSDHGEYFGEHPDFYHRLFHNFGIYNELLHVPLIIRYPPGLEKDGVVDAQVQNVDIMPTILHLAGIDEYDSPYPIHGKNLFVLAEEGGRDYTFSSVTAPQVGYILNKKQMQRVLKIYPDVRIKDWFKSYAALQNRQYKFVKDSLGIEQLFHLPLDPLESRDAAAEHEGIAEDMSDRLTKWERRLKDEALKEITIKANPETIKKLEQLGYIQEEDAEH